MSVAIVVDSAAAIPDDLSAELGIGIVPMHVVVDGHETLDSELSTDALLAALQSGPLSTSGPNPIEFVAAITRARGDGRDEVIVLTLSSEMSSTYNAAVTAAASHGKTRVIDTRTAAGGEGLVAVAAARAARTTNSAEAVETITRTVIDRVRVIAVVDDLGYLARSGRVPGIAQRAASALRVRPLFEFRNGNAHALTPAHGDRAAMRRIIARCLDDRPSDGATLHAAVMQAQESEQSHALLHALLEAEPRTDWFFGSFGPVMLAHVGPGLWGLAWWWET